MQSLRRLIVPTRRFSRGGFTLVELLVVIGIIAILAGVALGPITRGIKQAQESGTVQVAHQIGTLEFAYSNDYNQTYPVAATGRGIADLLLNNGYANTPSVFYVAATPAAAKYTGSSTPYNMTGAAAGTEGWDFMTNGTNGLTSVANDGTPLCELTGSTVFSGFPTTTGTGLTLTTKTDGTVGATAFGVDGIAVFYKGNNAKFVKTVANGAATAQCLPTAPVPWIDTSYADPLGGGYTLIQP